MITLEFILQAFFIIVIISKIKLHVIMWSFYACLKKLIDVYKMREFKQYVR